MNFKVLDCCPVPEKLYPELLAIKSATGCTYNSVYRGEDPNAQQFLTGSAPCYKHNQAWIYAHYPPGVANPPGYSTHELRNDGVAYSQYLRGAPIPWWACGIDVDDAHVAAVCANARTRGWIVTITYPGSSVEYHHVNFRQSPGVIRSAPAVLKKGAKGARVRRLQKKLAYIERPNKPGVTYLKHSDVDGTFGRGTKNAVQLFQTDHHQTADGVVGAHTRAQLKVCMRNEDRRHKIDDYKVKLHNAEDALAKAIKANQSARVHRFHKRVRRLRHRITKLGGDAT